MRCGPKVSLMILQPYAYVDFSAVTACVSRYVSAYYRYPSYDQDAELPRALRDSLSRGQLYSKLQVVDMLMYQPVRWRSGGFMGHWHGLLPRMLWAHGAIQDGRGVELSPFWSEFSNALNSDWSWSSVVGDVTDGMQNMGGCDLLVNTSCEHMSDVWLSNVACGTTVCAQSTDYDHPTHINRVSSLEQFVGKFSGYKIIDADSTRHEIYSRYTVLAVKL